MKTPFRAAILAGLLASQPAFASQAKWKTEPFANSSSRDFNPGLLGVTANVEFGWGRLP